MKWWKWALALLPAAAGMLVFGLIAYGTIPNNPMLYLRGSSSAVALWAGLIISTFIMVTLLWMQSAQKQHTLEIKEMAQQAREERRRFLQRLDHELKNPLTAIQTGLINIEQAKTEASLLEETQAVKSQVTRISRLVADLRKLFTLDSILIEETEVDLSEILREVVAMVENRPPEARREISLAVPTAPWPLPTVQGDPDLLLLTVHNLLDNAAKFTRPDDRIEVRAYEDQNHVVIEIADTGLGIPQEEIDLVWEELYRGEKARGLPGSGLGLPLVRAIIHLHHGEINLRSRPDQGTVFIVRLPIH